MPKATKPWIAVFSGPTATIQNTPPLLTSNKGRRLYGLPLLRDARGEALRYDALRPQRLAAPVTVFVEQFSAHPLEADAGELYAPPDGYVDAAGRFHASRTGADDVPVYRIELHPDDGLYPLPFMGRQASGAAWDGAAAEAGAPTSQTRQTFFPDGSRLYEEIDRLGTTETGTAGALAERAEFDFIRAVPSGGYTRGRDTGARAERFGEDFFPYAPAQHRADPPNVWLAHMANAVQTALASGRYAGAQWLDGTPTIDEALYWLSLTIDTPLPIVGHAAHAPAQSLGSDGARNILDGVGYIVSRCWDDGSGRDAVGAVLAVDGVAFAARDVTKVSARAGGFATTGGTGGIVGELGDRPRISYRPRHRHTWMSELRIPQLPSHVQARDGQPVAVKLDASTLNPDAIPTVDLFVYTRYSTPAESGGHITRWLAVERPAGQLLGLVYEGLTPWGTPPPAVEPALVQAALAGIPVVCCGRGNTGGRAVFEHPLLVTGDDLTGPKARMLLIAALLKLGALPRARDPLKPSDDELRAVQRGVRAFQAIFDSH